jgi:hypothetical protein
MPGWIEQYPDVGLRLMPRLLRSQLHRVSGSRGQVAHLEVRCIIICCAWPVAGQTGGT